MTSSLIFVIGRELTIFSISQKIVCKMSSVSLLSRLRTAIKTLRNVRICRSHTPPWCEARGGLNSQLTWRRRAAAITFWRSKPRRLLASSVWAPTRLVPLSDHTFKTSPLLATKRTKPFMNVSVSKLSSFSICTALLLKHVYRQPYRFTSARLFNIYRPKQINPNIGEWRLAR